MNRWPACQPERRFPSSTTELLSHYPAWVAHISSSVVCLNAMQMALKTTSLDNSSMLNFREKSRRSQGFYLDVHLDTVLEDHILVHTHLHILEGRSLLVGHRVVAVLYHSPVSTHFFFILTVPPVHIAYHIVLVPGAHTPSVVPAHSNLLVAGAAMGPAVVADTGLDFGCSLRLVGRYGCCSSSGVGRERALVKGQPRRLRMLVAAALREDHIFATW
jgi:hypothetical protein